MNIEDRARAYLAKMDPAISGSGGHDRTYAAAAVLTNGFALERDQALGLLREWNQTHCTPHWKDHELIHKIESALKSSHDKQRGYLIGDEKDYSSQSVPAATVPPTPPVPDWPAVDHAKIIELCNERFYFLEEIEQVSEEVTGIHPAAWHDPFAIIDNLFITPKNPNPLLCLAKDIRQAHTRRRSEWQDSLQRAQFIVPNPMSARTGKTQSGKESTRCLDNTGPRRFLVVECDFTPEKDQSLFTWLANHSATVADLSATVLLHLAEYAPLVMAVYSGGKSVHGWFHVQDRPESELKRFTQYACRLGADKATFTPCQLVRMPLGIRDNGKVQSVHYFNPGGLR